MSNDHSNGAVVAQHVDLNPSYCSGGVPPKGVNPNSNGTPRNQPGVYRSGIPFAPFLHHKKIHRGVPQKASPRNVCELYLLVGSAVFSSLIVRDTNRNTTALGCVGSSAVLKSAPAHPRKEMSLWSSFRTSPTRVASRKKKKNSTPMLTHKHTRTQRHRHPDTWMSLPSRSSTETPPVPSL